MTGDEIRTDVQAGIGRITLDRPRAINALTHGMVRAVSDALTRWADDPGVRAVLVEGAGERGLCAGGDIRTIHRDATTGGTGTLGFWADEYRLNARIARLSKPYVVFMDGLVMGGGVGISAHGSVRVVTERTKLAMPEVGIGFVPDVGGTRLLSRAPGRLGEHIALSAEQLSGADALYCGLADHYVPAERLPELADALAEGEPAEVVRSFETTPPEPGLAERRPMIDACYAAPDLEGVLARLRDHSADGVSVAERIRAHSPTALQVALRSVRTAPELPDLESVLRREYRVSAACLRSHDLAEGIRAQIIDKDRNPRWSPTRVADVDEHTVEGFFAPLGPQELDLASPEVAR